MALTHVATTQVSNHDAQINTRLPRPSGLAQGDVLVVFLGIIGQPDTTGEPSGWTHVGTRDSGPYLRTHVYQRVSSGSEPTSYQWDWESFFKNFGLLLAYRGVDPLAPLRESRSVADQDDTGFNTPQVQVGSGGRLLSMVAGRHDGAPQRTWTSDVSGDTERYDDGSDASDGKNVTGAVYDSGEIAAAGGYGRTLTASATVDLAAVWAVSLRAIAPAGGALPWIVGAARGAQGTPPDPVAFIGQADALDPENALDAVTVDVPGDTVDGQVMVGHIVAAADATITPPSGWTQLGATRTDGNLTTAVYWRVASSEPSDYTWSLDVFTRVAGRIIVYDNVDSSDPVADHGATGTTTTDTTIASPSVTATSGGWLLVLPGDRRDSPTEPQSWSTDDGGDVKRGEVTGATGSAFQASSAGIDSASGLPGGSTVSRTVTAAEPWGQVAVWALVLRRAS